MPRGRVNWRNLKSLCGFGLVIAFFGAVTGWWIPAFVLADLIGWFHPFWWEPVR